MLRRFLHYIVFIWRKIFRQPEPIMLCPFCKSPQFMPITEYDFASNKQSLGFVVCCPKMARLITKLAQEAKNKKLHQYD